MQEAYTIEELPAAVKSGEITAEKAARIIWEDIYKNPHKYGLFYFSEDQKSDFLLDTHKLFESIFDKFVPGITTFKTYISGCLATYKKTFLKKQLAMENERRTLDSFLRTKTEEESQKYLVSVADSYTEEKVQSQGKRTFADVTSQLKDTHERRNKRTAELTALILTMKACKDVDDDTISAVCDFTQVDKSLLYNEIQNLKQAMSKRAENHQKLIQRRNNAFFFHRKYMQEMISPDSTEKKRAILREKYMGQTKRWEEHNKTLSVHANSPSNDEIAKAIGIKPRMVSFYINHARKSKNIILMKKLYQQKADAEESPEENECDRREKPDSV